MSITGWFLDIVSRRNDGKVFKVKAKLRAWVKWDADSKTFMGYCPAMGILIRAAGQEEAERALREAIRVKAEVVDD